MDTIRTNSEPARGPGADVDLSTTDWTPPTNMKGCARSLWIGVAGHLKVDLLCPDGATSTHTFKNAGPGWWEGYVTKVYKTGTTATDIVAVS